MSSQVPRCVFLSLFLLPAQPPTPTRSLTLRLPLARTALKHTTTTKVKETKAATYAHKAATPTAAVAVAASASGTPLVAGPGQVVVAPIKGDLRMVPFSTSRMASCAIYVCFWPSINSYIRRHHRKGARNDRVRLGSWSSHVRRPLIWPEHWSNRVLRSYSSVSRNRAPPRSAPRARRRERSQVVNRMQPSRSPSRSRRLIRSGESTETLALRRVVADGCWF